MPIATCAPQLYPTKIQGIKRGRPPFEALPFLAFLPLEEWSHCQNHYFFTACAPGTKSAWVPPAHPGQGPAPDRRRADSGRGQFRRFAHCQVDGVWGPLSLPLRQRWPALYEPTLRQAPDD